MKTLNNNQFPSQAFISIVIPAFNEQARLPGFLRVLIRYCRENFVHYEIIVVDDGSVDKTASLVRDLQNNCTQLQLFALKKNRGKGYAVKYGLWRASGDIVIFLDADGSTQPDEILNNLSLFNEGYDIVIGSRVVESPNRRVKVRFFRKRIGQIFNCFVHCLLLKNIQDTQCGFKMFRREIIRPLFARTYINGFGFDMEVLFLANKLGYRIKEVGVNWAHVSGSKVRIVRDALRMMINIFQIRLWHSTPLNTDEKFMTVSEIKTMYDVEKDHWWFVSKRRMVEGLIRDEGGKTDDILDAGCGTGGNHAMLSSFGRLTGCDAITESVQFSVINQTTRSVQCNLEKLAFKNEEFDLVTALDVIEHLEDPVMALQEFRRVLKDSGRLVLTVPAFRFLWSEQDQLLCHMRRYNRQDLLDQLNEAGFTVKRWGYFFCATFIIVVIVRKLRGFLPRKNSLVSDTAKLPAPWINALLKKILAWEMMISNHIGLPFGSTIYAVAIKQGVRKEPASISHQLEENENFAVA